MKLWHHCHKLHTRNGEPFKRNEVLNLEVVKPRCKYLKRLRYTSILLNTLNNSWAMEQWTISYRKPGGALVSVGLWGGNIDILALRFHVGCGRRISDTAQLVECNNFQLQTVDEPIRKVIKRVLEQRKRQGGENWSLVNLETRLVVSPPRLYGHSLHECHFALVQKKMKPQ